jgi:hypothetical protein
MPSVRAFPLGKQPGVKKAALLDQSLNLLVPTFHRSRPDLPDELVKRIHEKDETQGTYAAQVVEMLDNAPNRVAHTADTTVLRDSQRTSSMNV